MSDQATQYPVNQSNLRPSGEKRRKKERKKMRWTVQSLTNLNLTISRPNPIEGRKGGGEKIQDQPNPLQP
jgi:hypothetical protein